MEAAAGADDELMEKFFEEGELSFEEMMHGLRKGILDGTGITLAAPLDENAPVPSCRNADAPYHEGQYVLTVDGFLVSGNVTVEEATVIDTGFAHSDHNPVSLTFTLNAD